MTPTIAWCEHLGVLKTWFDEAYFVDVAPLLEVFLGQIADELGQKKMVPVNEFLKATGEVLPFLDYGEYNKVTRSLSQSHSSDQSEPVSEVLGAAVIRLRNKGVIRIHQSADDPNTVTFPGERGSVQTVSAVEICK